MQIDSSLSEVLPSFVRAPNVLESLTGWYLYVLLKNDALPVFYLGKWLETMMIMYSVL